MDHYDIKIGFAKVGEVIVESGLNNEDIAFYFDVLLPKHLTRIRAAMEQKNNDRLPPDTTPPTDQGDSRAD